MSDKERHSTRVKHARIEATLAAARMQILLITRGDHNSAEFNVTPAFQNDLGFNGVGSLQRYSDSDKNETLTIHVMLQ